MTNRQNVRPVLSCLKRGLKAGIVAFALSLSAPLADGPAEGPANVAASAQHFNRWKVTLGLLEVCWGLYCYRGECCEPGGTFPQP